MTDRYGYHIFLTMMFSALFYNLFALSLYPEQSQYHLVGTIGACFTGGILRTGLFIMDELRDINLEIWKNLEIDGKT